MHPVVRTVLQRLGFGLLTLFVVSLIIFASVKALPGDFGQAVLGQSALPETVAAFRKELGLDLPVHEQYLDWLGGILTGDMGNSFSGRGSSGGQDRSRPVIELLAPRLANTLFLASMAAIISVPLALFLGITAALYRNSIYDRTVNALTLTTISFPPTSRISKRVLVPALAQEARQTTGNQSSRSRWPVSRPMSG